MKTPINWGMYLWQERSRPVFWICHILWHGYQPCYFPPLIRIVKVKRNGRAVVSKKKKKKRKEILTYKKIITVSCCCCWVTESCQILCDHIDYSTPGLYYTLEFAQTHVHWVSDVIQPFHSPSLPSPPALNLSQHQGLFQWVGSSQQVAKILELQLDIIMKTMWQWHKNSYLDQWNRSESPKLNHTSHQWIYDKGAKTTQPGKNSGAETAEYLPASEWTWPLISHQAQKSIQSQSIT